MKKPLLALLAILIIVIGVLMWWFSDSQVIKRQTHAWIDTLTILSTDGKTSRAGKTQDFSGLLDASVTCSVNISDYQSDFQHDELEAAHHMMVHNCESSSAQIGNLEISEITGTQATVQADLNLALTEQGGRKHGESCKLELIWTKTDAGTWKIESITIDQS